MKGILSRALENKEKVQLIYMAESGDISQRLVSIINFNEQHLTCFCHSKKQRRMFKVVNVLSVAPVKNIG